MNIPSVPPPDDLSKTLYALGTAMKTLQGTHDSTRNQVLQILTILQGSSTLGYEGMIERLDEVERMLEKTDKRLTHLTWVVGLLSFTQAAFVFVLYFWAFNV